MKRFFRSFVSTVALLGLFTSFNTSYAVNGAEQEVKDSPEHASILVPFKGHPTLNQQSTRDDKKENKNRGMFSFGASKIPVPIARHILSFLDPYDIVKATKVCKSWYEVIIGNRENLTQFIPHPFNIFSLHQQVLSKKTSSPEFIALINFEEEDIAETPLAGVSRPEAPFEQTETGVAQPKLEVSDLIRLLKQFPATFPFLCRLYVHLEPLEDYQDMCSSQVVEAIPELHPLLKAALKRTDFPINQFEELEKDPQNHMKLQQNLKIAKLLRSAGDTEAKNRMVLFFVHMLQNARQYDISVQEANEVIVSRRGKTFSFSDLCNSSEVNPIRDLFWATFTDNPQVSGIIFTLLDLYTSQSDEISDLNQKDFEKFGEYYFNVFQGTLTQREKERYFSILLNIINKQKNKGI